MLTDNISVSDKLSNSSIGTVKHLDKRWKPLCSTIYVTFDGSKAGNSLKDGRLRGELKECVPITAGMRFLSKKGRSTIIPWRIFMQLLHIGLKEVVWLISKVTWIDPLARKLQQGRIINNLYLRANFIPYFPMPKVLFLNFEPESIKADESALKEMVQMRKESIFSWQHALIELNSSNLCLFSIRSWNGHLEHFFSDKI